MTNLLYTFGVSAQMISDKAAMLRNIVNLHTCMLHIKLRVFQLIISLCFGGVGALIATFGAAKADGGRMKSDAIPGPRGIPGTRVATEGGREMT